MLAKCEAALDPKQDESVDKKLEQIANLKVVNEEFKDKFDKTKAGNLYKDMEEAHEAQMKKS